MEDVLLVDALGNEVSATVSIPAHAKSVVIISHGFGSSRNSSFKKELEGGLHASGIGTVGYEYYGHGPLYRGTYSVASDVTLTKAIESLKAVVAYVRAQGYGIGLVGSSFGGLVSLIVAAGDHDIKALALKSPVTEPIAFWKARLGDERIRQWEEAGVMHYSCPGEDYDLDFGFWKDLHSFDTLRSARNISCPTLIIQGGADTIVPREQSDILAGILHVPVHIVAGANHDYGTAEQRGAAKTLIVDFLTENL